MEAVLHFLTITRVAQQPLVQEQGDEEQRRHRDEAWDLEKDRPDGDEGEKKEKEGWVGEGRG